MHHVKNFSQKMAEAEELKAIENKRAALRRRVTQNNKAVVEIFPPQEQDKTRYKVAKQLGIGLNRIYPYNNFSL